MLRLNCAAIVERAERRLVRHLRIRNDIAPAQLDRIDVQLVRRGLHRALDQIARLRTAGAAIGRGRAGIGQHRVDRHVRGRDVVHADHCADLAERRQQLTVGRDVGADAGQHVQPQPDDLRTRIERQFDRADIVAPVLVREDHLGAFAPPLHRTFDLARRPQRQPVFDILPALGTEAAAHVVAHHAHAALRHLEHHVGEHVAHAVRVVHVGVQRVAIFRRIEGADRAARLHVLRMDARDRHSAA